jgi:hypothetical protein
METEETRRVPQAASGEGEWRRAGQLQFSGTRSPRSGPDASPVRRIDSRRTWFSKKQWFSKNDKTMRIMKGRQYCDMIAVTGLMRLSR